MAATCIPARGCKRRRQDQWARWGKGGSGSIRWRIGNRIYATLDRASGFYPRKLTRPQLRVDDDLTASLASRLVGAGIGQMLKPLAPQAGGTIRIRWGNRLLGQYTKAGGMMWARQTLPTDCKMADQPTVPVDRLGGSNRAASVNANFVAMAAPRIGQDPDHHPAPIDRRADPDHPGQRCDQLSRPVLTPTTWSCSTAMATGA
jgi:hypothetical protein